MEPRALAALKTRHSLASPLHPLVKSMRLEKLQSVVVDFADTQSELIVLLHLWNHMLTLFLSSSS